MSTGPSPRVFWNSLFPLDTDLHHRNDATGSTCTSTCPKIFWDPGSFNACCTSSWCACSGLCGAPSGETCLLAFVLPTYIHSKTMSWVEEEAVVNMWTESKPVTTEYECRCIVCKVDVSDTPIFCYVRLTRGMDLMSNACRLYNSAVQIASKSSLCVL